MHLSKSCLFLFLDFDSFASVVVFVKIILLFLQVYSEMTDCSI